MVMAESHGDGQRGWRLARSSDLSYFSVSPEAKDGLLGMSERRAVKLCYVQMVGEEIKQQLCCWLCLRETGAFYEEKGSKEL
jgi:hypothetical protein